MANPAFIASLLTPALAPGATYKGAANSLGAFGNMMEGKRANKVREGQSQQRIDMLGQQMERQQQADEEAKQAAAMARLQAALANPEDTLELQLGKEEAKKFGIDVQGIDRLMPGQQQAEMKPPAEEKGDLGVATTPEAAGEEAHEGLTEQAEAPPAWLRDEMERRGELPGQTPMSTAPASEEAHEGLTEQAEAPPAWLRDEMERRGELPGQTPMSTAPGRQNSELDRMLDEGSAAFEKRMYGEPGMSERMPAPITDEETQALQEAAEAQPEPPLAVEPTGPVPGATNKGHRIMSGETVPSKDDIIITRDGKPIARVSAKALLGRRERQAAGVGRVFEPLVTGGRDEREIHASKVAQESAIQAAREGFSRKEAVKIGVDRYNELIGRRYKRDYDKYPPGYGNTGGRGPGGPSLKERKEARISSTADANTYYKVVNAQRQQYDTDKVLASQSRLSTALELLNSGERLGENTAVGLHFKDLIGSQQTRAELKRVEGGMGMWTRAQELAAMILGGNKAPQIREELSNVLTTMSKGLMKRRLTAGQQAYLTAKALGLSESLAQRAFSESSGGLPFPKKKKKQKAKPKKEESGGKDDKAANEFL